MKFVLGVLTNIAGFLLLLLGFTIVAVVVYAASILLLYLATRSVEKPLCEEVREITPDEIKKRPASAPEL